MSRFARAFSCSILLGLSTLQPACTNVPVNTAQPQAPGLFSPAALAKEWDGHRLPLPPAPLLSHRDVEEQVRALSTLDPQFFRVEPLGASVEGRRVYHVAAGQGEFRVLLWSQMHGDEPSATPALFDLLHFLHRRRDAPEVKRLLSALTLDVVPMLNPDGADRFVRRNAQGVDINRDALLLQTPEGRLLKGVRDRYSPRLGFNLHNQSWRTSVGAPPKPASISLLSVAFDEARTVSEGRALTKRVCAVIRDALEPFIPGQIGRYDDEYEVRAFGDNITLWGTPVVLIETGPLAGEEPDHRLTRLNFVGLLTALDALATGRVHQADPARYEALPENESQLLHTIVRGARVVPGTGVGPFVADVGVGGARVIRERNGERSIAWTTRIDDVGDLRTLGALEEVDGRTLTLAPLFDETLRDGSELRLPEWSRDAPAKSVIMPGQPARLLLLEDLGEGRYRVVRVIAPGIAPQKEGPRPSGS